MYVKTVLLVLLVLFGLFHTSLQAETVSTTKNVPTKDTKKRPVKIVYRCPSVCDCPAIYQPVCGTTGLTHGNACLAACFKDKIVKVGACSNCAKPKKKTTSKCTYEKYGRNGKRRRCCTSIVQGEKVLSKKCSWVGPATYTKVVYDCTWKAVKGGKKKYCCSYVKRTTGKLCHVGKKKCQYKGKLLTTKFENNCRMQDYGKHGKRNYCCKVTRYCKGKTCKKDEKCSYTGPTYSTYVFSKCEWAKKKKWRRTKKML